MTPIELVAPATEEEALTALGSSAPGTLAVLAGGTDLLGDLESGRLRPERLLSLRRLPWQSHAWEGGGLKVGATEQLRQLETDPLLPARLPALLHAITAVGSPALRRQASLGGNLGRAAPASDLAPVLLALDAEVELVSASGVRTLPVDRFLQASRTTALGPAELVRSVRFPEARPTSSYLWQRVRPANDISQIGVAVAWSPDGSRWRTSLGGVPPRATLVEGAARALGGARPSAGELERAAAELAAAPALVSDRRATEDHRRRLAAALCTRAVTAALRRTPEGPS